MAFTEFTVDLKGVAPLGLIDSLPDGYYKGPILELRDHAGSNRKGFFIDIGVSEGPAKGRQQGTFMSQPDGSDGDLAPRSLAGLFGSIGVPQEKFGKMSVTKKLVGKIAHYHVKNPPKSEDPDAKNYARVTFITKDVYDAAVAGGFGGGEAPASSSKPANGSAAKPASKPAAPPPPAEAVDDLDALLNS